MPKIKVRTFSAVYPILISLVILGLNLVSDNTKISQTSWSSKGNSQFSSYDLAESISSIKILGICDESLSKPINIAFEREPNESNFLSIKLFTLENTNLEFIDDKCSIVVQKGSADIEVLTSGGALEIKPGKNLENVLSIIAVNSIMDFQFMIETSRYSPNSYRKIAFFAGALIFIVFFFLKRPKSPDKQNFVMNFKVMMFFSAITFSWGLFGPSIFDEGWTLVTGKTFQNLGWFSNVYSSASAPMPLGTPFNFITHYVLLLPKPLLAIRLIWAIFVILSYYQMVRILHNHFGTLKPKIQILAASVYFVIIISLCGGWRPEILGLILFNFLVLSVQSKVQLSPYLVGTLIAIGLSISQSGVINFAFLIILYYLREKSPKKIIKALFTFTGVFCWVVLSHSNLRQFIDGILAFRSVASHNSIPFFGEVKRYTQFFYSPQSILVTITFCFILLSLLNVLVKLKRCKKWDEMSLLLCFSILFLSITPSKWWWHLAPLSTLFVLHFLSILYTEDANKERFRRSKIENLSYLFMVVILIRSIYFNARISPTFPFINSTFLPQVLYSTFIFLAFIFIYFRNRKSIGLRKIHLFSNSTFIIGFISLSVILPVLQNYLNDSQSKVSNVFERRIDDTCKSLNGFYSLELDGQEILNAIQTNRKVVTSEAVQLHELNLVLPRRINNNAELILPIEVPRGSYIQIADENDDYLIVDSPRSNFTAKSEIPSYEDGLYEYSVSNEIPNTAYYIKATNRVQILRLREFDQSSGSLRIRLLTVGSYSVGNVKYSKLVTLDSEIGSSALGVIPPLVSNFGCISSNLFETYRPDNRMFLIQDSSMWFRDEQYATSEISGHVNKKIEVPIWDAQDFHLFNLIVFGF
jgi:hypothetical protein